MSRRHASGAEALCRTLRARGVSCVFGLPGTQSLGLYEALRRSGIRSVLATHELAAAFMANGYYRASGRIAAVFTIPGPGFAYALPALAEARHDSAALLHVVGQPPRTDRAFPFQALDQRAIAAPLVKAVVPIDRAGEVAERTAAAIDLALGGEPGPVLLEWALGALEDEVGAAPAVAPPAPPSAPDEGRVAETAALLGAARRSAIMAGQGAAGAAGLVRRLAEVLGAPVLTTTSGRGVLCEDHPLALGFDFARGGEAALNEMLEGCDCILVLGCKLTAAGTGLYRLRLPEDRVVRVDASPEVLATSRGRLCIPSTVEGFLERLLPRAEALSARDGRGWSPGDVAVWRARLRAGGDIALPDPVIHGVTPRRPAALFAALRRALPPEGIVVADSGLHQELVRRHFDVLSPRGLIVPSDFQSMGFGLPAAIGARLAAPERPVVLVIGDGGFAMSGLEILTAVRERIPLVVLVFNDGRLNRIRLEQLARWGASRDVDLRNPDFAAFARAVGARHARVDGDPEKVLGRAVASDRVTVVEVLVGDSAAVHLARARGAARGAALRTLGPGLLSRLMRRLR